MTTLLLPMLDFNTYKPVLKLETSSEVLSDASKTTTPLES